MHKHLIESDVLFTKWNFKKKYIIGLEDIPRSQPQESDLNSRPILFTQQISRVKLITYFVLLFFFIINTWIPVDWSIQGFKKFNLR